MDLAVDPRFGPPSNVWNRVTVAKSVSCCNRVTVAKICELLAKDHQMTQKLT